MKTKTKFGLLLLSLLLAASSIKAQKAIIQTQRGNILYPGVENIIQVAVPGYRNDQVIVSMYPPVDPSEKGEISVGASEPGITKVKKTKNPGEYIIECEVYYPAPDSHNEHHIYISVKEKDGRTRLIEERKFQVKPVPPPMIRYGSLTEGTYNLWPTRGQYYITTCENSFVFETCYYNLASCEFIHLSGNNFHYYRDSGDCYHTLVNINYYLKAGDLIHIQNPVFVMKRKPWIRVEGNPVTIRVKSTPAGRLWVLGSGKGSLDYMNGCDQYSLSCFIDSTTGYTHEKRFRSADTSNYEMYRIRYRAQVIREHHVYPTGQTEWLGDQHHYNSYYPNGALKAKGENLPQYYRFFHEQEQDSSGLDSAIRSEFTDIPFTVMGKWTFYHPNGKVRLEGRIDTCEDELVTQTPDRFDPSILIDTVILSYQTVPVGPWTLYDERGLVTAVICYDMSGKFKSKTYSRGPWHINWSRDTVTGYLREERFRNSDKSDIIKSESYRVSSGTKVISEMHTYPDGKTEWIADTNRYTAYYPGGKLKAEGGTLFRNYPFSAQREVDSTSTDSLVRNEFARIPLTVSGQWTFYYPSGKVRLEGRIDTCTYRILMTIPDPYDPSMLIDTLMPKIQTVPVDTWIYYDEKGAVKTRLIYNEWGKMVRKED